MSRGGWGAGSVRVYWVTVSLCHEKWLHVRVWMQVWQSGVALALRRVVSVSRGRVVIERVVYAGFG
jgi:hypothetical protein